MNLEGLRVVVADDEPIIGMNLCDMLSGCGFEIVANVGDGFDAIEACRQSEVDLVLLDIEMPVMDGLTAARCIFEENLAQAIIIVTAYGDDENIQRASGYGVSGYMIKPIDERNLLASIKIAWTRSQEIKTLKHEVREAKQQLATRKTIERAKGYVMERHQLSEAEAFQYIRDISKKKNMSMEQVATLLLRAKR